MNSVIRNNLWKLQWKWAPYLFIAPFFVMFFTFMLYPLLSSVRLSFMATNGPRSEVFVGLSNFRHLIGDPNFWLAVKNTTVFTLGSIFVQLPLSLGLALLLNAKWVKGREIFRIAFFSPHLVGKVFVAVLFSLIFAPRFGLLNRFIHFLSGSGLDTKWLMNPSLVMPSLILTALWMHVGFNMIYFLAALQSVDRTLYEAAEVDGANVFQRFIHVTLPAIRPVAAFVIIMSTIASYQMFELPYVLLNGPGPNNAGLSIVMYLYNTGFLIGDLGYASAIGWFLVLIIVSVSLVQARVIGLWRKEP
jgi:ABC-type sugar transport system permease subunit